MIFDLKKMANCMLITATNSDSSSPTRVNTQMNTTSTASATNDRIDKSSLSIEQTVLGQKSDFSRKNLINHFVKTNSNISKGNDLRDDELHSIESDLTKNLINFNSSEKNRIRNEFDDQATIRLNDDKSNESFKESNQTTSVDGSIEQPYRIPASIDSKITTRPATSPTELNSTDAVNSFTVDCSDISRSILKSTLTKFLNRDSTNESSFEPIENYQNLNQSKTLNFDKSNTLSLINHQQSNHCFKQHLDQSESNICSDRIANRCCADEKNKIKKELLKGSKNLLTSIGLEHVASNFMSIEQWRKLFLETNHIEKSNDEPEDWKSNEICLLCNSTDQQTNQQKNNFSSNSPASHQSTNLTTSSQPLNLLIHSILSSHTSNSIKNQSKNCFHNSSDKINNQLTPILKRSSSMMATTPMPMMTNTNNLINDSEHVNSFNTLISNENMANQNGTNDKSPSEIKNENFSQNSFIHSSDCQSKEYSSLFNCIKIEKLSCNCMNSDLDNCSIKSETLSNGSNLDQSNSDNLKMTISENNKSQLNSLANLLASNGLNQLSTNKLDSGLLDQMINQMTNQKTGEQPIDLSLNQRRDFDLSSLNDLNILASLYAQNDSSAGKIKKTKIEGTKKRSYTEEELGKALDDIKSGKLGTRRAAALYNIPRSTLRNKVHKMNNVNKKSIEGLSIRSMNDLEGNEESKCDQSSARDSLRELLKRNISSRTANESTEKNLSLVSSNNQEHNHSNADQNLEPNLEQNSQLNLENFQLLNNLSSDLNLLNGCLENNSNNLTNGLLNHLNHSNLLLTNSMDNNSLNNNPILNLMLFSLMKQQQLSLNERADQFKLGQKHINNRSEENLSNVQNMLDESMNSVLSNNSVASSALKLNLSDQLNNHIDDDTRSTLDDKAKQHQLINLENSNDEHDSEESNASLVALDEQFKLNNQGLLLRQKSANLSESLNSNNSLNLTNNNFLLSTLNLMNNPLNTLNQLSLANLANNLNGLNNYNNFNDLSNLNNLGLQFNMQPIIDQSKLNQQSNDPQTSTSSNSTVDPNRKRPKRGRYRNYNKNDLDEAVKAVQRGLMSVHRAGTLYGVPHSTLEYKVKERHLLRPSKRLKKQQEAAAQVANAIQSSSVISNDTSRSLIENELSSVKLKNALIGNHNNNKPIEKPQSIDRSSLLQQTLFQSASNLNQQSFQAASDLIKKIQENMQDDYRNQNQNS